MSRHSTTLQSRWQGRGDRKVSKILSQTYDAHKLKFLARADGLQVALVVLLLLCGPAASASQQGGANYTSGLSGAIQSAP
eukprot:1898906-Pyramimonas_sp.AAC.1